jgi:ornithine carbamoyltransferase
MESLSTQNTFSDVLEAYPTGVSFGCYLMSSGETVPTVSRLNNNCIDVVSVYLSDNASTISGNDTYDSIPQTLDYSFSMNIQEIIYDNQLTDQRHPEQKFTDTMMQQEAYQNNLIKQKQDLLTELKNKKEQITNKIKTIKPEFII